MSSPATTPYLESSSHVPAALTSPSPLGTSSPIVPLDDIPPLQLDTLESTNDKDTGLDLVAESVIEMQQRAAKALISHPLCVAPLAASLLSVYRFVYVPTRDYRIAFLLAVILLMVYVLFISWFTRKYRKLATQFTSCWIHNGRDILIGAWSKGCLIGVVVLRLDPRPIANNSKKRTRSFSFRGGRGLIRAWTTVPGERNKGVGKKLLAAAVRTTKERCGKDAELGFCKDHAHSTMILPKMFNGSFRRNEVLATKAVERALVDWEATKKKRR